MLPLGALSVCAAAPHRCLARREPEGAAERYRHEKTNVPGRWHLLCRNCIGRS
jgi:hypothetical protein